MSTTQRTVPLSSDPLLHAPSDADRALVEALGYHVAEQIAGAR